MGKHAFETVEREPLTLEQIGVRNTTDNKIQPFSGTQLRSSLRRKLMVGHTTTSTMLIDEVVNGVSANVLRNYMKAQRPLRANERKRYPQLRVAVLASAIVDMIEAELDREETRIQRVLYAGWSDAANVMVWLRKAFPTLDVAPAVPVKQSRMFRWSPPMTTHLPSVVLKKNNREAATFSYGQFLKSIQYALDGRLNADATADMVAKFVLDNLSGQTTVHSTQLAVGILSCLRQVDDIAYLRCVIVVKNLRRVSLIAEEAQGLMRTPSPRLSFERPTPRTVETGQPMVS
jgi:transcriptional regulator NrdR family protein